MSDPVIPERWKPQYEWKPMGASVARKCIEELGAAEGKVAEQATAINRMTKYARHEMECLWGYDGWPCTCGLSELLGLCSVCGRPTGGCCTINTNDAAIGNQEPPK